MFRRRNKHLPKIQNKLIGRYSFPRNLLRLYYNHTLHILNNVADHAFFFYTLTMTCIHDVVINYDQPITLFSSYRKNTEKSEITFHIFAHFDHALIYIKTSLKIAASQSDRHLAGGAQEKAYHRSI